MEAGGDQGEAAANARHQFERLVFFSDAVFAIAITLLVLNLRLPPSATGVADFSGVGPTLFGFALSFVVIGVYWLNHHRLFGHLQREDRALRLVNFAFLASIVFLPFPTSVIAEFRPDPATVSFYAVSVAAVGIALAALSLVAGRQTLLRPGKTVAGVRRMALSLLITPTVFLGSILLAQISPRWAIRSWLLLVPAHWLLAPRIERAWRGG